MKNSSTIYRRLAQLVDLAQERTLDDYNARGRAYAQQRAADRASLLEGRISAADIDEDDRDHLLFRLGIDLLAGI